MNKYNSGGGPSGVACRSKIRVRQKISPLGTSKIPKALYGVLPGVALSKQMRRGLNKSKVNKSNANNGAEVQEVSGGKQLQGRGDVYESGKTFLERIYSRLGLICISVINHWNLRMTYAYIRPK